MSTKKKAATCRGKSGQQRAPLPWASRSPWSWRIAFRETFNSPEPADGGDPVLQGTFTGSPAHPVNGSSRPLIHYTFHIWRLHSDLRRHERLSGVKSADVDWIKVQQRRDNMEKGTYLFGIHGKRDQAFAPCSRRFKTLAAEPPVGVATRAGQKVRLAPAPSDRAGGPPGELSTHVSAKETNACRFHQLEHFHNYLPVIVHAFTPAHAHVWPRQLFPW